MCTINANAVLTLSNCGFGFGMRRVETEVVIFFMSWFKGCCDCDWGSIVCCCCCICCSGMETDFPMISRPNFGTWVQAEEGRLRGTTPENNGHKIHPLLFVMSFISIFSTQVPRSPISQSFRKRPYPWWRTRGSRPDPAEAWHSGPGEGNAGSSAWRHR